MYLLVISVIAMLLGSGFFSSVEAALFSISLSKAKVLKDRGKKGADHLIMIKKDMRPTITVLVVFNNVFNIAGSIFVGALASEIFGSTMIGIFSAILTFLVIVFAEIIPKSIGETYTTRISLFIAKPLYYTTKAFYPLTRLIDLLTKFLPKKKGLVSEAEIRALSNIGYTEGVIEQDEIEMIHRVFLLNDLRAKDIMTPREMITAFEADKTLGDLDKEIHSLSHSRIPIYKGGLDNIVGICHQRDLLIAFSKGERGKSITNFITNEAARVHENKKIDGLIPFFQKKRFHLAIVMDSNGSTVGVISLEDVLEQIVGNVIDETDERNPVHEKLNQIKLKYSEKKQ